MRFRSTVIAIYAADIRRRGRDGMGMRCVLRGFAPVCLSSASWQAGSSFGAFRFPVELEHPPAARVAVAGQLEPGVEHRFAQRVPEGPSVS